MAQKKSRPLVTKVHKQQIWLETNWRNKKFGVQDVLHIFTELQDPTWGLEGPQSQGFLLKSVEPQLGLLDLIDSHQFSITNSVEESQPDGNI